jgi:hypothetical protein
VCIDTDEATNGRVEGVAFSSSNPIPYAAKRNDKGMSRKGSRRGAMTEVIRINTNSATPRVE